MPVLISVITPCYNHGQYLDDAIQSIPYDKLDYEVEHIIIDDGSTDPFTIQKISEINDPHIKIVQQENAGLSAARNAGIKVAKGKYIITLDADNKLHENYFTTAIQKLEQDDTVDIVYGNMHIFGASETVRCPGSFEPGRMLRANYIDACAVFRKKVFDELALYDVEMKHGFEDWDLWLNVYFKGAGFYYMNDIGFWYRITDSSMLRNITVPRFPEIRQYILKKYAVEITDYFLQKENRLHKDAARYQYAKKHPLKTIVKLVLKREI